MNVNEDALAFVPYGPERSVLYREKGYWTGETLIDFLRGCCEKYADKIALVHQKRTLTYRQLFAHAAGYGSYLIGQGIKENDFVVVQSPNVIEHFIIMFGILYSGARPVFCLNGHGEYEVANIISTSRACGYIRTVNAVESESVEKIVSQIKLKNPALDYIEIIQTSASEVFNIPESHIIPERKVTADAIAFLLLSGGTTGVPKLIPRTHDDYLYSVRESARICGLDEASRLLLVLPVAHNFPMSSPGFLGGFFAGSTVYLADTASPEICFPLIEKYKISQVSLVPSLVVLWSGSALFEAFDLTSLSVVQVGGARLLPDIAKKFIEKFNIVLQQVYGMAEGLVNYTRLDDDIETIVATQGRKISEDDDIVIVNEEGTSLGRGETGQIITRGPYTINCYYNLPAVNKISFTDDGYYKTGDVGYIDANGNIVVTGRLKEIINKGGEKVCPGDIESLLIDHPRIKDVSVVGIPDKILGEKIQVYAITVNNAPLTLPEVRKYLLDKQVAWHKLPDKLAVVTSFEYTLVGKVNKKTKVQG
ncbi:(2,3-dihydroxybenzoyl)adenylate synthase [Salmonella enterica subsp. diarizonae]|uniref:(2,3-dihydroxybenzoyl)adenylate synthase n=1 Tax=Salmonella diarizonae TaxID=59204 RepID=A0A5Y3WB36_SALDZ|nr:(2,3-dihydroxybenzoyl)adenylate synthase [Salmonella enterica subsp. diarizonae]ECJ4380495.1 (2,3-dihydroxybenzoyl)adenylate synthase [Salmonella enterica subsp. diarizonae]